MNGLTSTSFFPFQLRRVTWWTRNDPDEPVLTDDEEDDDDDGKKDDREINVDEVTTGQ